MDSNILLLPDEILFNIIGFLNKQDTINLSLTHSRFAHLCQLKLLKKIYIYNDDKFFKFTKKARYIDESLNFTVTGLSKFTQLLSSSKGKTISEIKEIIVANDDIAYMDYFEFLKKKKLPVQYDRIREVDINQWLRTKDIVNDVLILLELAELKRKSQLLAQSQQFTKNKDNITEHFLVLVIVIGIFVAAMYYFGFFSGSLFDIAFNPANQFSDTFDQWLN